MKTVNVYYAGIPAKNTKPEKRDVLTYFHKGIKHWSNDKSKTIEEANWYPSDLAVIQGWVHENSGSSAHLNFRRNVIEQQKKAGARTLAIDSNLFLYKDPGNKNHYLRFSLDGVFPNTGEYFTRTVDPRRWKQIKNDIGIDLKPWRLTGEHILICLQRNGGWSMKHNDVIKWCKKIIKELRKYTNRPIVIRKHPGDKKIEFRLHEIREKNVIISKRNDINDDFENAWATITFNSSPGVASAIEGIPVFVTDPDPLSSQAFDIANFDLKDIEEPGMPERQHWIERIAMCHFNYNDLKDGTAWKIIREYV